MMTPYRMIGWMIGAALLASPVYADQRVLFRFGDGAVQVYRVMQLDEITDFSTADSNESSEGMIVMRWLDRDGAVLASTAVTDPRITRSPNHTNSFVQSRLGLASGGWVATGPDEAELVSVEMPGRGALGLAAETWLLSLSEG